MYKKIAVKLMVECLLQIWLEIFVKCSKMFIGEKYRKNEDFFINQDQIGLISYSVLKTQNKGI